MQVAQQGIHITFFRSVHHSAICDLTYNFVVQQQYTTCRTSIVKYLNLHKQKHTKVIAYFHNGNNVCYTPKVKLYCELINK